MIRILETPEIVADDVRKRIIRGELHKGDSLPPEGQLSTSLGISRPTLREAFRIFEAESLISVMCGSRRQRASIINGRLANLARAA